MRRLLLVAPLLLLAQPAAAESSIMLDQPNPVYGQTVTFTAVYPKEATRKVGRQQQWNPAVQVDCYQGGVWVFRGNNAFFKDEHLPSGELTGVSGPIILGAAGNENTWTEGAASCVATLFYFGHDELIHVLAQTAFEVSA
jgi:hypothetical protein